MKSMSISHLSGTPANIPLETDCALRSFAWEYGKHLLPGRGQFKTLFDALQLSECNVTSPMGDDDVYRPPHTALPRAGRILHVSTAGSDSANGTHDAPFRTLKRAVAAAASMRDGSNATVVVHGGEYYLDAPLQLTAAHSNLTIQNYANEYVRISGGVNFTVRERNPR